MFLLFQVSDRCEGDVEELKRRYFKNCAMDLNVSRRQSHRPSPCFFTKNGGIFHLFIFWGRSEFGNFFGKGQYAAISRRKSRNSQKSAKRNIRTTTQYLLSFISCLFFYFSYITRQLFIYFLKICSFFFAVYFCLKAYLIPILTPFLSIII